MGKWQLLQAFKPRENLEPRAKNPNGGLAEILAEMEVPELPQEAAR